MFATFSNNIKHLSFIGCQSEIPLNSARLRMNRKFCYRSATRILNYRGAKINLKVGIINNRMPLKRILYIRDGKVLREKKFGHTKGYTLQMLVSGKAIYEVQLIDEEVFKSNFNQMFLLGRYRKDLYEETYNAFPNSRLFKVKF